MKKRLPVLFGILFVLLIGCQQKEKFVIELGNQIMMDAELYFEGESGSIDIKYKDNDLIEGMDGIFLKVGRYKASYNNENFYIVVEDRTAPQIKGPQHLYTQLNTEININEYYEILDHSDTSELLIKGNLDINNKGTYRLELYVEDALKLSTNKIVYVHVGIEEPKIEESVYLDVPYINQLEIGAPNGCETTALFMAHEYKGNDNQLEIIKFIDDEPRGITPYEGFSGDPFSRAENASDYYTIFPSALVPYANKHMNVENISNSNLEELKSELSLGNPVVAYVTGSLKEPTYRNYYFGRVVKNIHIVLLIGYDNERNVFIYHDPSREANMEVSYEDFMRSYEPMSYAIAVR